MPTEDEQLKESIISQSAEEINDTLDKATQGSGAKSTMTAVMFGMMAAALGTGIFNLPLRITQVGLITFIIYVLLAAGFSYMGADMLAKLVKAKSYDSYSDASQDAFGPVLKRLSQFCLILFPWGITICFQVILAKFAIQLLADVLDCKLYKDRQNQVYNSEGNMVRILINVVVIITDFFLISLKNMKILQKLAMVSVSSSVYNVIVIFILFIIGFHHTGPNLDYHGLFHIDWSKVRFFIFNGSETISQHSQALASVLFCYVNHQLVFPTVKNMEDPTLKRLQTCFKRTNLGQMTIYLFMGISGYLLLVEHEDIEPIGPMVLTSITVWPMLLGKFFMIIALYIAIPINMFPARTILSEAIGAEKTNRNHYLLSLALAVSSCGIAITFQKVNSYFGLLGGTAGVLMAGTIPAICFYKILIAEGDKPKKGSDIAKLIFCGVITLVGFTGAILSVLDPA